MESVATAEALEESLRDERNDREMVERRGRGYVVRNDQGTVAGSNRGKDVELNCGSNVDGTVSRAYSQPCYTSRIQMLTDVRTSRTQSNPRDVEFNCNSQSAEATSYPSHNRGVEGEKRRGFSAAVSNSISSSNDSVFLNNTTFRTINRKSFADEASPPKLTKTDDTEAKLCASVPCGFSRNVVKSANSVYASRNSSRTSTGSSDALISASVGRRNSIVADLRSHSNGSDNLKSFSRLPSPLAKSAETKLASRSTNRSSCSSGRRSLPPASCNDNVEHVRFLSQPLPGTPPLIDFEPCVGRPVAAYSPTLNHSSSVSKMDSGKSLSRNGQLVARTNSRSSISSPLSRLALASPSSSVSSSSNSSTSSTSSSSASGGKRKMLNAFELCSEESRKSLYAKRTKIASSRPAQTPSPFQQPRRLPYSGENSAPASFRYTPDCSVSDTNSSSGLPSPTSRSNVKNVSTVPDSRRVRSESVGTKTRDSSYVQNGNSVSRAQCERNEETAKRRSSLSEQLRPSSQCLPRFSPRPSYEATSLPRPEVTRAVPSSQGRTVAPPVGLSTLRRTCVTPVACDEDSLSRFPSPRSPVSVSPVGAFHRPIAIASPAPSDCSTASSGAMSVKRITAARVERPASEVSLMSTPAGAFSPQATNATPRSLESIKRRLLRSCTPNANRACSQAVVERVDDSNLSEDELSRWQPLPNDTCNETASNENDFLSLYGAVPYEASVDGDRDGRVRSHPVTVVSSRVTRLRYSFPENVSLESDQMERHFANSGHTLAIDYTRTYARFFALDVDCMCRKASRGPDGTLSPSFVHVDEDLVRDALRLACNVIDSYMQRVGLPECTSSMRYEVWRNGCGFHVYTDVPVSLPFHLLVRRWVSGRFSGRPCVFEVPDEMPLPFSAKHSGSPYRLAFGSTEPPKVLTAVMTTFVDTFDLVPVHTLRLQETFVTRIELRGSCNSEDDLIFVQRDGGECPVRPRRSRVPFVPRDAVTAVTCDPHFEQLTCYVRHRLRYLSSAPCRSAAVLNRSASAVDDALLLDMMVTNNGERATGSESPVSHVTYGPGYDENFDDEIHRIGNSNLRQRTREFFRAFNTLFFGVPNNTSCRGFLEIVTDPCDGSLMLQHYVVAMHKCLSPVTTEEMRDVLLATLAAVRHENPCVARFITWYDERIVNSYTETGESMLTHLCRLRSAGITAFSNLEQQVEALMVASLQIPNAAQFKAKVARAAKPEEKMDLRTQAIEAYAEALHELRVVLCNKTSQVFYVFDGDGYVMHVNIGKHLPRVIYSWVGNQKSIAEAIALHVEGTVPHIPENELFTMSHFMFATTVGTFNSLSSMYCSKSRFLRYTCYRYTSIWVPDRPRVMYPTQNEDVLQLLLRCEPIVRVVLEDPCQLFVHFILAPAILQLDSIGFIEEAWVSQFLQIIMRYPNMEHAYFLTGYYPLDPAYVMVLMHLHNRYGNFNVVASYRRLMHQVLQYEEGKRDAWIRKLGPVYDSATYDSDAETYMDVLVSLRGDGVNSVTHEFAFYAWVMALLLTKTTHHEPFVSALYKPSRNLSKRDHPEYRDFDPVVGSGTSRANKERAARIIFGEEAWARDRNFIDTAFSLGMSAFFDPANMIELLSVLSYMFVPYNRHKKLFLFYGYGNNGKSFICNLIQDMTMPKTGRFQNLDSAMERSNVTLKNTVTILNEVQRVDSSKIKTVTGNDPESTKIFYSQVYEMCRSQSLIYGATNKVVEFRGETLADVATVDRFHVIKLHGRQVRSDRPISCLFQLLVHEELLPHAVGLTEWQMVPYANMIAYLTYLLNRDEHLYPTIDVDNECNREYRDLIYRRNNRLYDFLRSIDLVEAENFSISTERLLHLVGVNIRDQKRPPYFKTVDGFCKQFASYYGVNLMSETVAPNLQEAHIVEHIKRNTMVEECPDSVITSADLKKQTLMYMSEAVADNAATYLQSRYPNHFDQRKRCFVGLRFVNPPLKFDPLSEPFRPDRIKCLRNEAKFATLMDHRPENDTCDQGDEVSALNPPVVRTFNRVANIDRTVQEDRTI